MICGLIRTWIHLPISSSKILLEIKPKFVSLMSKLAMYSQNEKTGQCKLKNYKFQDTTPIYNQIIWSNMVIGRAGLVSLRGQPSVWPSCCSCLLSCRSCRPWFSGCPPVLLGSAPVLPLWCWSLPPCLGWPWCSGLPPPHAGVLWKHPVVALLHVLALTWQSLQTDIVISLQSSVCPCTLSSNANRGPTDTPLHPLPIHPNPSMTNSPPRTHPVIQLNRCLMKMLCPHYWAIGCGRRGRGDSLPNSTAVSYSLFSPWARLCLPRTSILHSSATTGSLNKAASMETDQARQLQFTQN